MNLDFSPYEGSSVEPQTHGYQSQCIQYCEADNDSYLSRCEGGHGGAVSTQGRQLVWLYLPRRLNIKSNRVIKDGSKVLDDIIYLIGVEYFVQITDLE